MDSFSPAVPFRDAAHAFVRLVERIDPAALTSPGLGAWDLRALVGHTSRSLVTVETYVQRPADRVDIETAAGYYAATAALVADPAAIEQRGRDAGVALGDSPAAVVAGLADRAVAQVEAADLEMPIETIAGGMRLGPYLRTRTFELVVHGIDIARATGLPHESAPAPLMDALSLAAEIAATRPEGVDVLAALTGRGPWPSGLSVV